MGGDLVMLVAMPIGLGLLGFVEPCTIGSTLLFLGYLEGRSAREQATQTFVFAAVRMLVMGVLGIAAALVGALFVGFQKGVWVLMGVAYLALGLAYLTGRADRLKRGFGIGLQRLQGLRGAAALGLVFAFNIPACAGPLLVALLAAAAVAEAANAARGFLMLALFGLALSLPIVAAVLVPGARRLLERMALHAGRVPAAIGLAFVILGLWSIRFAAVAEVV